MRHNISFAAEAQNTLIATTEGMTTPKNSNHFQMRGRFSEVKSNERKKLLANGPPGR